nr:EscU/YscU/HrcU family type III secretion system export apparatus switch protein [Desulfobulbaceae bacterium]
MPQKKSSIKQKPKKKAVALRYDRGKDSAPKIVGKGQGLLAQKILDLAAEHGIPIHPDADLIEVLSLLNLNEEIPPETYVIVAEILAFVYRTNQSYNPKAG